MPDEAAPIAAPAAPPAAPPAPVVAAPQPALPPDGVILTKRELEAHAQRAAAAALEQYQKEHPVPEKKEPKVEEPKVDEVAKLRDEFAAWKTASEAKNAELEKQLVEERNKSEIERKARRRARQEKIEAQLRAEAAKAGIEDDDYALVLFARASSDALNKKDAAGNPTPDPVPDPTAFFAALRKTKPGIFKQDLSVPATTAAAPAPQPGAEAPPPPAAGGRTPASNEETPVDQMDRMAFGRHAFSKYGYDPRTAS